MIEYLMKFLPYMLQSTVVTIEIFVLTLVLALPLGLPIALGSNSRIKPLAWLCRLFVLVFRGTPLMLQLFFFYFFFPLVLHLQISVFLTVILTFVLNYSAYLAEIYRGGINSVDKGQHEAAFALGLSKKQTMLDIILPQTMKAVLPPIVNEAITLVKDTALAAGGTDESNQQFGQQNDGYHTNVVCSVDLSDYDTGADCSCRQTGKTFCKI